MTKPTVEGDLKHEIASAVSATIVNIRHMADQHDAKALQEECDETVEAIMQAIAKAEQKTKETGLRVQIENITPKVHGAPTLKEMLPEETIDQIMHAVSRDTDWYLEQLPQTYRSGDVTYWLALRKVYNNKWHADYWKVKNKVTVAFFGTNVRIARDTPLQAVKALYEKLKAEGLL